MSRASCSIRIGSAPTARPRSPRSSRATTAGSSRTRCRSSGSDRRTFTSATSTRGRDLPDRLRLGEVRHASAGCRDGSGFYYTRFPEPGAVAAGDENYFCSRLLSSRWATRRPSTAWCSTCRIAQRSRLRCRGRARRSLGRDHRASRDRATRAKSHLIDRRFETAGPRPLFTGFTVPARSSTPPTGGCSFARTSARPWGASSPIDPQAPAQRRGSRRPAARQAVRGADRRTVARGRLPAPRERSPPRCSVSTVARTAKSRCLGSAPFRASTDSPDRTGSFFGFTSFTHPPASYRLRASKADA